MYFEVFGDAKAAGRAKSVWVSVRCDVRSNDYLDSDQITQVKEASVNALKKYGSGCSGSRLLNGKAGPSHQTRSRGWPSSWQEPPDLRHRLSGELRDPLSALTEKGDVLICDHNLHACWWRERPARRAHGPLPP